MAWGIAIGSLIAFGAIVLVLLRVRAKSPWLGPLYWHELVKLARRGGQAKLRAAYAILLLVGLLVLYLRVFSHVDPFELLFNSQIQLPQSQKDAFIEWFTVIFFLVQIVYVSLITPVYAGGAIAEEKDRKTLEYLQTSLLSNQEIVLGKLAARLTFVTLIVLVGLPILLMVMHFGGLDPMTIFLCFLVTIFTMLGLAGFSLFMGVYRNTLRDTLYWPYGLLIVGTLFGFLTTCCCPIPGLQALSPISCIVAVFTWNAQGGAMAAIFGLSGSSMSVTLVTIFCLLYGLSFLIFTTAAVYGIRTPIRQPTIDPDTGRRRTSSESKKARIVSAQRATTKDEPKPTTEQAPPIDLNSMNADGDLSPRRRRPRIIKARRSFRVKPLRDGDPFLWKEKYFSGRLPVLESGIAWGCVVAVISVFLGVVGITLFAGILITISENQYPAEVINFSLRLFVTGTILGLAPVVGLRAAGSVTKERQQQTLLSLLTIPESRNRILFAKWLAPLMSVRWWLISLAIALVLAVFTAGVHPFGAIAACCYLVGFVPFANSLGLWLSLRCKSSLSAMLIFFAVMAILFIGPPIFGTLFRAAITLISADSAMGMLYEQFLDSINPLVGLWQSLVNWSDFGINPMPIGRSSPLNPHPDTTKARLISTLVIGMLYTAGTAIFAWLSVVRFKRETV